jgi:probable HAF family extracellular repeat protein
MKTLLTLVCSAYAAAGQSNPSPSSQAIDVNNVGMIVGIRGGIPAIWQKERFIGNLPLLSGAPAAPVAINNKGDVVGNSGGHAVLWSAGRIYDLGTLPGDTSSQALDINDSGVVVGNSCSATSVCRAVVWTNRVIAALPVYPALGPLTAEAINNSGQVLRTASLDVGPPAGVAQGYLLDFNSAGLSFTVTVRPLWGFTGPAKVNDRGEIVSNAFARSGCGHETDGVFWKNSTWSCFGNVGLVEPGACPTRPSFFTAATGLNNKGDLVGWVASPFGIAAQLEDRKGTVSVLPPLTACGITYPSAINDSRLIVGNTISALIGGVPLQAVLWEDGKVQALK